MGDTVQIAAGRYLDRLLLLGTAFMGDHLEGKYVNYPVKGLSNTNAA